MAENPNYDSSIADAFRLAKWPTGEPVEDERIERWNRYFAENNHPMIKKATSWRNETTDPDANFSHVILEYIEGQTERDADFTWRTIHWDDQPELKYQFNQQSGHIYTIDKSRMKIYERDSPEYAKIKRGLGLLANEVFGL